MPSTSITALAAAALGLSVGVVAMVFVGRSEPHVPESAPASSGAAAASLHPAKTERGGDVDDRGMTECRSALARMETDLLRSRAQLAAAQHEHPPATKFAWDEVPAPFRPAAFERVTDEVLARHGFSVSTVDCSDFPCVALLPEEVAYADRDEFSAIRAEIAEQLGSSAQDQSQQWSGARPGSEGEGPRVTIQQAVVFVPEEFVDDVEDDLETRLDAYRTEFKRLLRAEADGS